MSESRKRDHTRVTFDIFLAMAAFIYVCYLCIDSYEANARQAAEIKHVAPSVAAEAAPKRRAVIEPYVPKKGELPGLAEMPELKQEPYYWPGCEAEKAQAKRLHAPLSKIVKRDEWMRSMIRKLKEIYNR